MNWSSATLTLGHCGRVRCEPGWRLDERWWRRLADFDLWFVWAGRGRMWLSGGRELALRPGVCVWMRPGERYEAEQDPNDRLGVTFIHFDLQQADGRRPASLPAEVHEMADLTYAAGVLRRIVELCWQAGGTQTRPKATPAAVQLMRGVLMDVSSATHSADAVSGTARHHRDLVHRLITRIREAPGESPSVEQLAAEVGYSADHLTRVFRQVLGVTPQTLLVNERISRARQLLTESSLTVQQIADVLGYSSVYFFSRQFKQKTGRSPSRYRQA